MIYYSKIQGNVEVTWVSYPWPLLITCFQSHTGVCSLQQVIKIDSRLRPLRPQKFKERALNSVLSRKVTTKEATNKISTRIFAKMNIRSTRICHQSYYINSTPNLGEKSMEVPLLGKYLSPNDFEEWWSSRWGCGSRCWSWSLRSLLADYGVNSDWCILCHRSVVVPSLPIYWSSTPSDRW